MTDRKILENLIKKYGKNTLLNELNSETFNRAHATEMDNSKYNERIPGKKDFRKMSGGAYEVEWYCPYIVKSCINDIKCTYKNSTELEKNTADVSALDTLRANIFTRFATPVIIFTLESSSKEFNYIHLQGIDASAMNVMEAKNLILKVFRMIEANPDNLRILIDVHNNACNHIHRGKGGMNRIPSEYDVDIDDILAEFE